ncbi:hypothetical protein ACVWWG_008784 [Bradyrhizobium sp. LB7.2]
MPLLGAATQEDHQHAAVPPEIDPVAGAAVDLQFGRALTDRLDVRGISIGKSSNCNGDSCGGLRIEPVIPIPKRDTTVVLYSAISIFGTIFVTNFLFQNFRILEIYC